MATRLMVRLVYESLMRLIVIGGFESSCGGPCLSRDFWKHSKLLALETKSGKEDSDV